ncbi:MAG: CDP-glucose 4,6-dehydratase [bacterium]
MISGKFWENRKVLVTGHTGFKGAWLCLCLHCLGAKVTGYALEPPTCPSLFDLTGVKDMVDSHIADVLDAEKLACVVKDSGSEVIIHMAAQALVRDSYKDPVATYATNVMGTINLLEAVRTCEGVRAVVNVTSDKCYENKEWPWGYRETESLGGYDPYSSSKACSEIVTAAYRRSFFNHGDHFQHRAGVASARAGNVIGGGDWAADRLIPDCIRAFLKKETVSIRSPEAIRPWQFVLSPLYGYLMLAERLYRDGSDYAMAWNFGPDSCDEKPAGWVVQKLFEKLQVADGYMFDKGVHPHESGCLKLDSSLARLRLGWKPVWDLEKTLDAIVEWTVAYQNGDDIKRVCFNQIAEFTRSIAEN